MTKNLEPVVSMVLSSFQNPHPRVRWAAVNAVGQLSTDLGPHLQNQYHHLVLPALGSAMDDYQNPRVQVGGISSLLLVCLLLEVKLRLFGRKHVQNMDQWEILTHGIYDKAY